MKINRCPNLKGEFCNLTKDVKCSQKHYCLLKVIANRLKNNVCKDCEITTQSKCMFYCKKEFARDIFNFMEVEEV